MYLSKKSIICILWCEFFNNLDAKSDFDKQDWKYFQKRELS